MIKFYLHSKITIELIAFFFFDWTSVQGACGNKMIPPCWTAGMALVCRLSSQAVGCYFYQSDTHRAAEAAGCCWRRTVARDIGFDPRMITNLMHPSKFHYSIFRLIEESPIGKLSIYFWGIFRVSAFLICWRRHIIFMIRFNFITGASGNVHANKAKSSWWEKYCFGETALFQHIQYMQHQLEFEAPSAKRRINAILFGMCHQLSSGSCNS